MIYVYPFQQSKQHEGKTSLLTADPSNHKSPCFVLFYQESGKISIIQQLHYFSDSNLCSTSPHPTDRTHMYRFSEWKFRNSPMGSAILRPELPKPINLVLCHPEPEQQIKRPGKISVSRAFSLILFFWAKSTSELISHTGSSVWIRPPLYIHLGLRG